MGAIARLAGLVLLGFPILFVAVEARSQSETPPTAEELARQIGALKQDYEERVAVLEAQLATLQAEARATREKAEAGAGRPAVSQDNAFNPAIGVVLNGMVRSHSADESEFTGFQIGHESERPDKGISLGHSEATLSGSIDASSTATSPSASASMRASRPRSSSRKPTSRPCPAQACPTDFDSRRAVHSGPSAT